MKTTKIHKLVKSLEKYFYGFKAEENLLTNDAGLKLLFTETWNEKTKVSGIGGKHNHTIGCSFTKSLDKIAKDIRNRLLPDYKEDFFAYKCERIKYKQVNEEKLLKLKALAQASNGEIKDKYGTSSVQYVCANDHSIEEDYEGNYRHTIELDFSDSLKLAEFLSKNNSARR